jgi:hypothetical protein
VHFVRSFCGGVSYATIDPDLATGEPSRLEVALLPLRTRCRRLLFSSGRITIRGGLDRNLNRFSDDHPLLLPMSMFCVLVLTSSIQTQSMASCPYRSGSLGAAPFQHRPSKGRERPLPRRTLPPQSSSQHRGRRRSLELPDLLTAVPHPLKCRHRSKAARSRACHRFLPVGRVRL